MATLNCNGLRACLRKGLEDWIDRRQPDVLCLQEVRARSKDLGSWAERPCGMHANWAPATRSGYAGVAVLSRRVPDKVEKSFGAELFDTEGRWLRADFGPLTVVSLYLPSGTAGEERQAVKYRCLDLLFERLRMLGRRRKQVIIAGDLNIAHTAKDICNWKGNLNHSGFLPVERAWLSALCDELGWVDALRAVDDRAGRFTWWSQRAGARQRNVGWRIDYQLVTPSLRASIRSAEIDSEPLLSDHAPLVVDYRS